MTRRLLLAFTLWAIGCADKSGDTASVHGAPKRAHFPFPSMHMVSDGHLDLPTDLPMAAGGTPVQTHRLAWRTGFSVAQSAVIDLDTAIDPESLPAQGQPRTDGAVQIWDLTAGQPVLCFAELDAADPVADEFPALIVRPQELLTAGHRVAVVLTNQVRVEPTGEPLGTVPWYRDVLAGTPGPGLEDWVEHYQSLDAQLAELGVEDIQLAFDFPVSDGGAPARHVTGAVEVPSGYVIDEVRKTDDGILMPEGGWVQIRGRFSTTNWLVDDLYTALDDSGLPVRQGTTEAELRIYIPESVRGAASGSVPVWIFGHGLFGKPDMYLGDRDDPSKVAKLADEAGAIVFATVWRGFKDSDRIHAVDIADDFGRIHEITERLTQGVSDVAALARLIRETDILNDPVLMGLPDSEAGLRYYGISLGGIAGAVMVANTPAIEHAVFNVGGSAWSTMLERSSQWIPFDWIMVENIPSPRDRQLLYALSQLFWDPVDPLNHAEALRERSVLWQEALGDEQVPNMTTRVLMRAVGATLLEPSLEPVEGVPSEAGPLRGPAYAQFDPEKERPVQANRPGVPSGAHGAVRTWPGARQQTAHFNHPSEPGEAAHFCGDLPCTASNPGS